MFSPPRAKKCGHQVDVSVSRSRDLGLFRCSDEGETCSWLNITRDDSSFSLVSLKSRAPKADRKTTASLGGGARILHAGESGRSWYRAELPTAVRPCCFSTFVERYQTTTNH